MSYVRRRCLLSTVAEELTISTLACALIDELHYKDAVNED